MTSPAPPTKAKAAKSLEDTIFERLTAWQEQHADELAALDDYRKLPLKQRRQMEKDGIAPPPEPDRDYEAEGMISEFLYSELRGVATVLPGLGWQANNPNVDVSCRFSSALNKAFLRILEKWPDRMMRAKSRRQLTGFVSRIMSRMMLHHYKRKGLFRKVIAKAGLTADEETEVADIISQLADEKGAYFEERTGVGFERGLKQIEAWDESADPDDQQMSEVLRLRYIDGLGYDQIADDLGITKVEVENTLERAKYRLRPKTKKSKR